MSILTVISLVLTVGGTVVAAIANSKKQEETIKKEIAKLHLHK